MCACGCGYGALETPVHGIDNDWRVEKKNNKKSTQQRKKPMEEKVVEKKRENA